MSTEKNRSVLALLCSRQGVPTVLVAVAGIAASLAVFFGAYFWELRSVREGFESLADDRFHATESMFAESARLIDFMDNVFLIGPKATAPEFTGYVRSLKAFLESDLSKQLSVHGITWMPRVPRAERSAYERTAQAVFDPNYRIRQQQASADKDAGGKREDSYPSYLSMGKTLLRDRLGEDLSLDPATWKVMQQACDTGDAVATAPIKMSADPKSSLGYRVFQPLYAGGDAKTVEQRRKTCTGFICLDLDLGVMIDKALQEIKSVGIEVWVYDNAGPNRVAVCRHTSHLQSAAASDEGNSVSGELESTEPAKFFGRELLLQSRATEAFWARRTIWQPWVLLCSGLALTLAMAGHQLSVALRTSVIEQVVSTRLAAIQKEVALQQFTKSEKFRPGAQP